MLTLMVSVWVLSPPRPESPAGRSEKVGWLISTQPGYKPIVSGLISGSIETVKKSIIWLVLVILSDTWAALLGAISTICELISNLIIFIIPFQDATFDFLF